MMHPHVGPLNILNRALPKHKLSKLYYNQCLPSQIYRRMIHLLQAQAIDGGGPVKKKQCSADNIQELHSKVYPLE